MSNNSSNFLPRWVDGVRRSAPDIARWYAAPLGDMMSHARRRLDAMPAPLSTDDLAEWQAWLAAHGATETVLARAAQLAQAGTLCVVSGQQAGLFGGPLYSLYKGAGAAHLAARIEREVGAACVPLFWVASDDHDFAEVAVHHWIDGDGAVRTWRASDDPRDAGKPVFARALDGEFVERCVAELVAATPPSANRDALVAFLRDIATPPTGATTATFESQFVRAMLRWLGPLGVVPIAPRLRFMRRRAVPIMQRELDAPGATATLVKTAGEALEREGAKGIVLHRSGDEANFFVEVDGVRAKAAWHDDALVLQRPDDGREVMRLNAIEARRLLATDPDAFSPNAALRPIVQDAALPTVAYVAGPSELVYHAQIGALYPHFGVFRPIVVPRPSAVLIEPRVPRLADRIGISLNDALANGSAAIHDAAARAADATALRPRATAALEAIATQLGVLDALSIETGDAGVVRTVGKMRESLDAGRERLAERLNELLLKRGETIASQARKLDAALFPNDEPQERVLGVVSPLMRLFGPDAARAVASALDGDDGTMRVVELGGLFKDKD